MYCKFCGVKNDDDSIFCIACGRQISNDSNEKINSANEEQEKSSTSINQIQRKFNFSKVLKNIFIAFGMSILFTGVAIFLYGVANEPPYPDATASDKLYKKIHFPYMYSNDANDSSPSVADTGRIPKLSSPQEIYNAVGDLSSIKKDSTGSIGSVNFTTDGGTKYDAGFSINGLENPGASLNEYRKERFHEDLQQKSILMFASSFIFMLFILLLIRGNKFYS